MPAARERWEFIVYVGAVVFVFSCKMLVFVLMAEGWLRDSGPINFVRDYRRPHADERVNLHCWS